MGQHILVGIIVVGAVVQSLRALLPFRVRVAVARRLSGHVPDRCIVWFAGQGACDACGGRTAPHGRDQRTQ
jgi:hypothetical protein